MHLPTIVDLTVVLCLILHHPAYFAQNNDFTDFKLTVNQPFRFN